MSQQKLHEDILYDGAIPVTSRHECENSPQKDGLMQRSGLPPPPPRSVSPIDDGQISDSVLELAKRQSGLPPPPDRMSSTTDDSTDIPGIFSRFDSLNNQWEQVSEVTSERSTVRRMISRFSVANVSQSSTTPNQLDQVSPINKNSRFESQNVVSTPIVFDRPSIRSVIGRFSAASSRPSSVITAMDTPRTFVPPDIASDGQGMKSDVKSEERERQTEGILRSPSPTSTRKSNQGATGSNLIDEDSDEELYHIHDQKFQRALNRMIWFLMQIMIMGTLCGLGIDKLTEEGIGHRIPILMVVLTLFSTLTGLFL